jgi:hypothetical protein
MSTRLVTVFSTVGNNEKTIETSATTWKELKAELANQGVNVSGMKVVIGESQLTLESPDAALPTEEFTLFLLPEKVKSGSWMDDNENDEGEEEYIGTPSIPTNVIRDKDQALQVLSTIKADVARLEQFLTSQSLAPANPIQAKAEELKRKFGSSANQW